MKLTLTKCFLCSLGFTIANLFSAYIEQTSFEEAYRVSFFQFWSIMTLAFICWLDSFGGED